MNKVQKSLAAAGAALALVAVEAQAALPPEAANALSTISGNVSDILTGIWPIVAAVAGGFALISLFKKGASKAV